MRHSLIVGLTSLLLLSTSAKSADSFGVAKESERLGYRTYREKSGGVTVLVDTTLAGQSGTSPYVPFTVAVRLAAGTPNATISRESFTLIDAAGNRVPMASAMEIREHGKVQFDVAVMRSQGMAIGQQFDTDLEVRSRFFGDKDGMGVIQDRVNLGPQSWFQDLVYFPRPPAGLDGIVTVRVESAGFKAPIEVRVPILDTTKKTR